jgi:hypothetical protein
MDNTTLTLENLIAIYEAMNKIKPIDQSDYFKQYFEEVKNRIEEEELLNTMRKREKVFEWKAKNGGGEQFKFFIDEEKRACFSVSCESYELANLIMPKKAFVELINDLTEIMKNVKK